MTQILLAVVLLIASGYAAGRLHQWIRYGPDRDQAYRDGYDQASQVMFDVVHRMRHGAPAPRPGNDMEAVR